MCTDARLTEMCRVIFGDIVVKATYQTEDNMRYKRKSTIELNDKGDTLDWDSEEFLVEFTSGAVVKFQNSEWASLERLNNHADPQ